MVSSEKSFKDNASSNGTIAAALKEERSDDSITFDEELGVSINEKEEPYTIFSKARLIQFVVVTSFTGMLSPITGSIYFPSVNQIEAVSISL